MVRFRFLTGDVDWLSYGGKWISNRQSNGKFDYYFVIELLNWEESVGERNAPAERYNVALSVVSPQEAGEENLSAAYSSAGVTDEMLEHAKRSGVLAEIQVEALHDYCGGVPVWNVNGNNARALLRQARHEAQNA